MLLPHFAHPNVIGTQIGDRLPEHHNHLGLLARSIEKSTTQLINRKGRYNGLGEVTFFGPNGKIGLCQTLTGDQQPSAITLRLFDHLTDNTAQVLTEDRLISTVLPAGGNGNRKKDFPRQMMTL